MSAPFTFNLIPLGQGGVAPCVQCEHTGKDARAPRPAEEVLAELATLPAEARDVAFGGFEPFAHPELPRLIAAAGERGAGGLLLRTDGGALASGGNAEGAVMTGARVFEVIYHAGDDDADDTLTGRPGLAQARQAGIYTLRRVEVQHPDLHLMMVGVAALCRHGGRGAALPDIALAAVRDGLDAVRIEAQPGAIPNEQQRAAALEILIPAGIWLFGDGCEGATPYRFTVSTNPELLP